MMNRKKKEKNTTNINTISREESQSDIDISKFIDDKIEYIQEIIRKTILSIKKHNQTGIFSNNDSTLSLSILNDLYKATVEVKTKNDTCTNNSDSTIESLQKIIDKLSMIICGFGTEEIDDLLFISFGSEYKIMNIENPVKKSKYKLIRENIHPIGYKIIHWKQQKQASSCNETVCCNKITDEYTAPEDANTFECYDTDVSPEHFYQKVFGIRVVIQNERLRKTLVINGIINDIHIDCFNNEYMNEQKKSFIQLSDTLLLQEKELIDRVVETMALKDILIYSKNDIQKKMYAIFTEVNLIKQTKLDLIINRFLDTEQYNQRDLIINLLLYNKDNEVQYICYLLYELICIKPNYSTDTHTHMNIYDSLPWKLKSHFKDIVKYTIKYANDIMQKFDIHKISLEQQIYTLKASETVKEKAVAKLKEIKGRQDENCNKAKQYLEGLIRIPFSVYKEEPILKKMKDINKLFHQMINIVAQIFPELKISIKQKYTSIEVSRINTLLLNHIRGNILTLIESTCHSKHIKKISKIIQYINNIKKQNRQHRITITNCTKSQQISRVLDFASQNKLVLNTELYDVISDKTPVSLVNIINDLNSVSANVNAVETTMNEIVKVLDDSIYGHIHAKNQIMKIIGQWMNGEQTGYCFGFEGSPGVGKTSLAKKGLAKCLVDENGTSRPFSFIALGGSCNGSSLEGHGYTYVNSTWGRIVDILMESKCMNPIIYIDELDKVSKTENGKEIIGIFTHLIDQTQNDTFQDKYFSGIDIDLSKALFIFSYNDPDQIDKVLLDRIHRIKFENLSVDDKVTIVNKYMLPEINNKMGFDNIVSISDDIIEHIITNYTTEPGVRKLKEILFDIYGEINLEILKINHLTNDAFKLPVTITAENLEIKYLKKYSKIREKNIHDTPEVGIINGLWANSLGCGGIIPIQTLFFPSSVFLDLRLTGLQGDVMKESMNVAKSLAWNLTPDETKSELLDRFTKTMCQGLHVHCPEGAVAKDGPSAGAAITTAIYSLFNNTPIKNDVAITGEINLKGEITAIGGLELKINGGIRAGVKTFLYPKANHRDFLNWKQTSRQNSNREIPTFIEVETIDEVFKHTFI